MTSVLFLQGLLKEARERPSGEVRESGGKEREDNPDEGGRECLENFPRYGRRETKKDSQSRIGGLSDSLCKEKPSSLPSSSGGQELSQQIASSSKRRIRQCSYAARRSLKSYGPIQTPKTDLSELESRMERRRTVYVHS